MKEPNPYSTNAVSPADDDVAQCSWKQPFQPGISTAFLVVYGAVYGLLGGRPRTKSFNPSSVYTILDGGKAGRLELLMDQVTTPRPLDLKRLHEEAELLHRTLQKIVDRSIADGLEVELYARPAHLFPRFGLDAEHHSHLVYCYVDRFCHLSTTMSRKFYSRTNALSFVTIDRVQVFCGEDHHRPSLSIDFHLSEADEARTLAEPELLPGTDGLPSGQYLLAEARILRDEGHAFYDTLQRDWWRLPMVHFWFLVSACYLLVTVPLVLRDLLQPDKPLELIQLTLTRTGIEVLVIVPVVWKICAYFERTGVMDRLRASSGQEKRTSWDDDTARMWRLLLAAVVPLFQAFGMRRVAELREQSFWSIEYIVEWLLAFVCLALYPGLSLYSSWAIFDAMIVSVYSIVWFPFTWRDDITLQPQWGRQRAMWTMLRRVAILCMAVCVCFWYDHLSNDGQNPSAQITPYWVTTHFYVVGVVALLVLLVAAFFFVVGVVVELVQMLRRIAPGYKATLPRHL